MRLFIYTLGCRVNQCESESIAQAFSNSGHEILHSHENANLIIVNTCTVTTKAEQKARRVIRIFASYAPVIVTGCYAQVNPKEIEALSQNVFVLPLSKKATLLRLPSYIEERKSIDIKSVIKMFILESGINSTVFDYAATGFEYHCRSYLKIQDGCDNNCGFCRVHIARGKSVSLDSDIVVSRALDIEKNGYHEIVLSGVNLTMFDHNGNGLGGLLEKMLNKLGSGIRIRLSSLEPDHIDDRLIDCLSDNRMQPYFHIPIQSASDNVIKRVNRKYDSKHLESVITKLRQIKEDPFLACDVITGLPGEKEEDFEITKSFLTKHCFALMHVFPFSPRPDTALYKAKDRVPESIRDKRALILRDLSEIQNSQYEIRQIGKKNEVILEDHKNGLWYGLSGNYMKMEVSGVNENAHCGDLVDVVVTDKGKCKAINNS